MVSSELSALDNPRANKWAHRRNTLLNRPEFDWLKNSFGDLQSVDNIVYGLTSALISSPPKYDPYQVESLSAAISTLLDRCLSYRDEMYALDEKALKRCSDYALFLDTFDAQKTLEQSPKTIDQLEAGLTGQKNAVAAFGSASGTASGLGPGFAALYQGSATATQIGIDWESVRQNLVATKWEKTKENQDALAQRYTLPGSALNYAERYSRLRTLLSQDLTVAFQKTRCLSKGCNKIFGKLNLSLEEPFRFGYLEYLVYYVRDLAAAVELATIEEIDFQQTISFRAPRVIKTNPLKTFQLFNNDTWNRTLTPTNTGHNAGLFSFSLNKSIFPTAIRRLRVRSIGMSLLSDNPDSPGWSVKQRTSSAVIFPPPMENLFSPGSGIPRPPVVVDAFCQFDATNPRFVTLPAVSNIDPREDRFGGWQVQISTSMMWPDLSPHPRNELQIYDIKLHLKLSATVDKSSAAWSDFSA